MKVLKISEFGQGVFEGHDTEDVAVVDFGKYMGGRFPRNAESLKNAPVGSTCDMTSWKAHPLFWDNRVYTWHYLMKREDGMWEEVEKWDVNSPKHEPVENGVVLSPNDILKAETGSLYMSLPVFDKNGNLLCIPVNWVDQDICKTTKMELLSSIKNRADRLGRTLYGKTYGEGEKAVVELGNEVWFTRDCKEFRNTVRFQL
jgi:hypothetical protein